MEFDIGTLIYIIITIIAIVAGVAGKKKKPAGKSTSPGSGSSSGFFDRLEEQLGGFMDETKEKVSSVANEFTGEKEEAEPVKQQEVKQEDRIIHDYRNEEEFDSEYNQYEGVYDPEQQEKLDLITDEAIRSTEDSEILEVIEMEPANQPDYFEIVRDFDLGTAVIYSSIINRREY